ncbi:MAG: hypothetical protein QW835_03840, partial [Candidatus Hadarchaeum sp.]
RAESAGTKPAAAVNPMAVEVMREVGIDISAAKPKMITREMLEAADRVITMGCISGELCPATLVPTEDWGIEDPAGKSIEKFREIRELIRIRVEKLVEEMER